MRNCPSLQSHWVWEGVRATTIKRQQPADLHQGFRVGTCVPIISVIIEFSSTSAAIVNASCGQNALSLPSCCPEKSPLAATPDWWHSPRHPATGSTGKSSGFLHGTTKGCSRSPSALMSFQGFLNCWFGWLVLRPC